MISITDTVKNFRLWQLSHFVMSLYKQHCSGCLEYVYENGGSRQKKGGISWPGVQKPYACELRLLQ